MPVRNGAEFIADALRSVYDQTVLPGEVIVVDNGSTDETPNILQRSEGRPGFRSLRKSAEGEASSRNAGVGEASGEYIAFLDHDDLWLPRKLEIQVARFEPRWGMSFTAHERVTPRRDLRRARRRLLEAARIRPQSVRPGWLKHTI